MYRHKAVLCFSFWVVRPFRPPRSTGQQQFPAPPGVLDMDGFHCSIHFHMGNKAVGTVNKNAVCDFSVFQSLLHFQYRIREPCPSCLPRYSSTTILPLSLLQSSCLIHPLRPGIEAAENHLHGVIRVIFQPLCHCFDCNLRGIFQRVAIHAGRNCRERNAMDIMLFGKVQRLR